MRILELSEEAINGLSDNTLYFLYKNVEFNPSLFCNILQKLECALQLQYKRVIM